MRDVWWFIHLAYGLVVMACLIQVAAALWAVRQNVRRLLRGDDGS